jgi:hypothetical protein
MRFRTRSIILVGVAGAGYLERESQRQLSYASIYSRATDDTERGRGEVCVGVRKLRMVQRIEKLSTKLKATFLDRPIDYQRF